MKWKIRMLGSFHPSSLRYIILGTRSMRVNRELPSRYLSSFALIFIKPPCIKRMGLMGDLGSLSQSQPYPTVSSDDHTGIVPTISLSYFSLFTCLPACYVARPCCVTSPGLKPGPIIVLRLQRKYTVVFFRLRRSVNYCSLITDSPPFAK